LLSRLLSENHGNNLSTDQVEYANVIQSSGKGLLTLIDEILDLSKIESGKMDLELADVSIQSITHEMHSLFNAIAKEKNLDFHISVEKDIPAIIETDKLRLEQILRNLISNALKFTKKGSVELKIARQDSSIAFAVKDTGIGIPKEKQQTIFEAFQQADGSTRRQYGGTGLGLSISRELAKLLGGEIKLNSEPGRGSEFTLRLPLEKIKSVPSKAGVSTLENISINERGANVQTQDSADYITDKIPASIPDDRQLVSKSDKVILIIEDDTAFARSLLDYTRAKGYKGIVAVRGDEGVELAKQFLPLGILLDVQLPVRSGWEVMEELKSDPNTRPIPVHMMSSHEVKTRSLSKGAVDFINKPVAFEKLGEIFQKIENALSRHPKKVLIVEENTKHAEALAYFLESYNVATEIRDSIDEGVKVLSGKGVDCVILDMGIPAQRSYDVLEDVKKSPGLENLPIIVFTGKNLSHVEEMKIKQYADSIVVKTAHSYERILDEVSLFLHLVEDNKKESKTYRYKKMGELGEVLKGKTILIADDDVRNIFSLTKSLENFGIKVLSAIDGREALKQLQEKEKVDLVLMDMMMPEMDGYESTKRIRNIPKYKNLPIIAVTAKAMTGDREKCIAAGASDYITKPVDVDQLISLLRVWLYGVQ
jgi:CheY-like chemotaxis protein/two-component sensor histidine kinase